MQEHGGFQLAGVGATAGEHALAPLFGEPVRDFTPMIAGMFAFQVIGVACIGFLSWFWILSIYPASNMASFSFLSPVFGVIFGWLILDETIDKTIIIALVLVSLGVILVNRKPAYIQV